MIAQMPIAMAFGQMLSNTASPMMQKGMQGLGNGMATQGQMGNFNLKNPTEPGANTGFLGFGMANTAVNNAQNVENTEEGAKKFCPECGNEVKEGAKFCSNCGHKIEEEKKEVKCSNCGRILNDNEKFCPECGTKRDE